MIETRNYSPSATYYDCGICGHLHPIEWNGDCREDASRFTSDELDTHYGPGVDWFEVEMPEWSGSPCPIDPDNYWIDDETGERVNATTGERSTVEEA